ncbi:MAG TPA: pseudouridine synthase, partial [Cyanobacteria bacterium UBA11371]|nr:pseudouridine synthase [Cyanobacteria bacterium UBA11371]
MTERLQKILSQWGIASRRQAEEMILAGRVKVNGSVVDLGQKADPSCDRIEVDGKLVQPAHRPAPIYLLLHKPAGVVSTCSDPQNRPTVLDLLPPKLRQGQGIHPVGRLDADSTGALLLTNDGDLTFHLSHPRHSIAKTYHVWVESQPPEDILQTWRSGVVLDGKKTLPAQVVLLKTQPKSNKTLLEIVLTEGRNRQIRRVAEQLGYPVLQ